MHPRSNFVRLDPTLDEAASSEDCLVPSGSACYEEVMDNLDNLIITNDPFPKPALKQAYKGLAGTVPLNSSTEG